ncbi:MAG: hypothetical protein HXX80_02090 [Nitrososphaerales archaeon]|nr:hypothetical protein [Nitrososphaerales archaeon]
MNSYAKGIMSILTISMLLAASVPLMTSAFGVPTGADSADWYMTVEGVLDTDKYTLYPYSAKSLNIGFSKFGEMVNSIDNVGLEYGGERDPFAPPAGPSVTEAMPKRVWQEGWLINITYMSTITGFLRNVWAEAMHADLLDYGNGWIRVDDEYPGSSPSESAEDPRDRGLYIGSSPALYGFGGRKTNGTVVTEDIEVLYDGPRRFVARLVNTISDWIQLDGPDTAIDVPLVQVIITIDFNKDKKEVNLFKDVKLITTKAVFGAIPISYWFPTEPVSTINSSVATTYPNVSDWFSDPDSPGYQEGHAPGGNVSYIPSVYHEFAGLFIQFSNRGEWDLGKPDTYQSYVHFFTEGNQKPPFDYILPTTPKPQPAGPDENITEGLATVYDYPYELTTTIFPNYYSRHGSEPDTASGDTFDVAQIIGSEGVGAAPKYVGFAAYWPSLSDWSVDSQRMSQWWKSLTTEDAHTIDRPDEPFKSPNLIGEWDFMLSDSAFTISYPWQPDSMAPIKVDKQFRGVTTYGLTDIHNNAVLDSSDFQYKWCNFSFTGIKDLGLEPLGDGRPWSEIWGVVERMEPYPPRYFIPYEDYYWPNTPDNRSIPWVGRGFDDNFNGPSPWVPNYNENIIDNEVAYQLYEKFKPWDLQKASEKATSRFVEFGLGLSEDDEDGGYDFIHLQMTSMEDFLPFYSEAYWYDDDDGVVGDDPIELGEWGAYCTFAERVLVEMDPEDEPGVLTLLTRGVDYKIYTYSGLNDAWIYFEDADGDPVDIPEGALIKVLYSTYGGSYEWVTVGMDSRAVDSVGSSMITEAFDSIKDIPVWKPSLDIKDTQFGATVPFLLRKFGTGYARSDYYYSTTDHRLALKDDWSSTWPIASSNIITVGGPLANAVTEYFNEFGQAIYRGSNFGENDFLLTSDWGATFLGPTRDPPYQLNTVVDPAEEGLEGSGIGIVSTHKDINGTVGLYVYGYSGDDTVWTSKLFFNLNTIPIFLDDGNGQLDWTDVNDNGLLDPWDLGYTGFEERTEKWVPKLHQYAWGWWAGNDLLLGFIVPDDYDEPKWFFMPLLMILQKENPGVTELVIRIYYDIPNSVNPYVIDSGDFFSEEIHPVALIVEELGTISEKPQHPDP